jgi:DNA-binding beta-propeller fold protein YncE
VSVVDLESLAVEREIEVLVNPTRLAADGRGDVYVISSGNYADVPNTLQRIDGATGAVNALGEGTLFAVAGDSLYVVYARYGDPSPSFRIYNMLTEAFEPEAFLSGGPAFGAVSAIAVDPVGGDIYIADAKDYVSSGALYVFSPEGVLKKSEDTGGPDPAVILLRVR